MTRLNLEQSSALRPFMGKLVMLTSIAGWASNHDIAYIIRSAPTYRNDMINVIGFSNFGLTVVAFPFLVFVLLFNIAMGILTARRSFPHASSMGFYSTLFRMSVIVSFLPFTDRFRITLNAQAVKHPHSFRCNRIGTPKRLPPLVFSRSAYSIFSFRAYLTSRTQYVFAFANSSKVFSCSGFDFFADCTPSISLGNTFSSAFQGIFLTPRLINALFALVLEAIGSVFIEAEKFVSCGLKLLTHRAALLRYNVVHKGHSLSRLGVFQYRRGIIIYTSSIPQTRL